MPWKDIGTAALTCSLLVASVTFSFWQVVSWDVDVEEKEYSRDKAFMIVRSKLKEIRKKHENKKSATNTTNGKNASSFGYYADTDEWGQESQQLFQVIVNKYNEDMLVNPTEDFTIMKDKPKKKDSKFGVKDIPYDSLLSFHSTTDSGLKDLYVFSYLLQFF